MIGNTFGKRREGLGGDLGLQILRRDLDHVEFGRRRLGRGLGFRKQGELSLGERQPPEGPEGRHQLGRVGRIEAHDRREGVAPQGFGPHQGHRIGELRVERKIREGEQQLGGGLPPPVRLAPEHLDQLPIDLGVLKHIPHQAPVVEPELQVPAQASLQEAG